MNIKLIGYDCSNGIKLFKQLDKALNKLKIESNIEKIDSSCKNKYGIKNIPGLVINGQIISQGKVLTEKEIKKLILV